MSLLLASVLFLGVTVEDRVLEKQSSIYLSASVAYLDRNDLWTSPGVRLEASHFLDERLAIDYLRVAYYFSSESDQAAAVREATGFVPNRPRPRLWGGPGFRYAFAYGKLLLEDLESVVYASVELAAHLGVLITDDSVEPAADLSLAVRVALADRLILLLDYSLVVNSQPSDGRWILGGTPSLGVGVRL